MIDDPVQAPAAAADEPLFVNVTHMDRDRYFEAVKTRARSGRNLALLLGGIVVAVIGLFMASRWVALLGVMTFSLTVLSPAVIGRRDYRKLCERHPSGVWEKTVRFYSDRLESDAGDGNVTTAGYGDIRHEYESERMYILDFGKAYPASAIDKSGFVKGSMEELRTFLTEARRAEYAPKEPVD